MAPVFAGSLFTQPAQVNIKNGFLEDKKLVLDGVGDASSSFTHLTQLLSCLDLMLHIPPILTNSILN